MVAAASLCDVCVVFVRLSVCCSAIDDAHPASVVELDLNDNARIGGGGVQALLAGYTAHPTVGASAGAGAAAGAGGAVVGGVEESKSGDSSTSSAAPTVDDAGGVGEGVAPLVSGPLLPSLRQLLLKNCGLTDACASALASGMQRSAPSVTVLELGGNGITCSGASALAVGVCEQVSSLRLAGNAIGDDGV